MQRSHEIVPSRAMERGIHVWKFGHFGPPLLVFPSASGVAHEWDAHGMVEALSDLLDGGRLKLYCAESNVSEAWTRRENDAAWRLRRHLAFESFVLRELVPWIREDCRSPEIRIAAAGTSLGAFYAANFALKHSAVFHYALCMSGRYDISEFAGGSSSLDVYYNNPIAYAANLNGDLLTEIRRRTHLTLVCGQGKWEDGNIEETRAFASILAAKGIPHELDLWGHDVSHAWPWWCRQAAFHLGRTFGR